jgi:hypothetical protein
MPRSTATKKPTPDETIHRHPVSSSAISSVGYDPRLSTLEVEFKSGAVYDYHGVPPKVYKSLLEAPSKGRFISRRIRDRFEFSRRVD